MRISRAAVLAVFATTVLGLGAATASGPARDSNVAATEAALRELESSPNKDSAAEFVTRSRTALRRAVSLRKQGDEAHAGIADELAKTWADSARALLRAVDIEAKANAARLGATDAGSLANRERALLEEGIAQRGRLRAQLDGLESAAKLRPLRTSAAAAGASDGGSGAAEMSVVPARREAGAP